MTVYSIIQLNQQQQILFDRTMYVLDCLKRQQKKFIDDPIASFLRNKRFHHCKLIA